MRGLLSITGFFSLSVSLLGIISFLTLIIKDRKHLPTYMRIMRQDVTERCSKLKTKLMPSPPVSTTAAPINTVVASTANECGQIASVSDQSYEDRDEIPGDLSPLPAYGHLSTLPHVPEVDEEEETIFGPDSHARHEVEEEGVAIQDEAPPSTYSHYEIPYPAQNDNDVMVEPPVVKVKKNINMFIFIYICRFPLVHWIGD